MHTTKPSPSDGRVFIARDVTSIIKKGQSAEPAGRSVMGMAWIVAVTFFGALGLTIAAALHRQWAGILWGLAGMTPGYLLLAATGSVLRWLKWKRANAVPSEEERVRLDRLREMTADAVSRLPRAGPGKEGWLTEEGWQLGDGASRSWSEFRTCGLARSKDGDFLLHLTQKEFPRKWRPLIYATVVLLGTGPVIMGIGLCRLLPSLGARDDVLALASLTLGYVACSGGAAREAFRRHGFRPASRTAWVPVRATAREELEDLLRQHLVVD